ncbi:MAG: hypothetical protein MI702_08060 [Chlorobiales bacterium]|nr:hypothetical protein [Chlorobiales bacterium]
MAKQYARCKADMDTAWWDYAPRSQHENWEARDSKGTWDTPPATVSLSIRSAGHTKDRFALPESWLDYVARLNGGKDADEFKALMRKAGGWNNVGDIENPKVESLAWWGSVLEIQGIEGNYAAISSFRHRNPPPNSTSVNYDNNPEVVHQFTAISGQGIMRLLGSGYRAYSVLISREQLYVPLDRIELFPKLPREVKTLADLDTYQSPPRNGQLTKNKTKLTAGQWVKVFDYAVRATDVWGLTLQGWIALAIGSPSRFLTTWEMETRPAV